MSFAIRGTAMAMSGLTDDQIQEVLVEVLDTSDIPDNMLPVVLSYNAKLMTELRVLKTWPPYLRENA